MYQPTLLALGLLVLPLHYCQASPVATANQACIQFYVPVTVSTHNALYGTPEIADNIGAVEYAVHADTWSTLPSTQRVKQNITVSGNYSISAQLCTPKAKPDQGKSHILQIATHGLAFDKRYWDAEIEPVSYSYVSSATAAGYSILTYDRLGTGMSEKPDAYSIVQAPLELQILRQLTIMARSGALYDISRKQKGCPAPIKALLNPDKIVHIGHSFGSFLSSALLTSYGNLSDGAIITGFIPNKELPQTRATSFGLELGRLVDPKFSKLPNGYLVQRTASNIQTIFFHKDNFDPKVLAYSNEIKQPIAVGVYDSLPQLNLGYGPDFKGPLQYMEAEFDFAICDGDCENTYNVASLKQIYPLAKVIEAYIQPGAGHGLTLHRNATAGYMVSLEFLARNGL